MPSNQLLDCLYSANREVTQTSVKIYLLLLKSTPNSWYTMNPPNKDCHLPSSVVILLLSVHLKEFPSNPMICSLLLRIIVYFPLQSKRLKLWSTKYLLQSLTQILGNVLNIMTQCLICCDNQIKPLS